MMNDNRKPRPAAVVFALYGHPDRPNACPCTSRGVFMDGQNLNGKRGPFFVWCPDCNRTGPERPTYDLALATWNRATALCELSATQVLD